eukprot:8774180-Alexandrium_andersonii.AAC.1
MYNCLKQTASSMRFAESSNPRNSGTAFQLLAPRECLKASPRRGPASRDPEVRGARWGRGFGRCQPGDIRHL